MLNASDRKKAWLIVGVLPVVTCAIGSLAAWQWLSYPLGTGCGLTLFLLLFITMYTDSRWKKIPNWATYPTLAWLFVFNLFASCCPQASNPPVYAQTIGAEIIGAETIGDMIVGPASLGAIGIGPSLLGALCCFAVMVVLSGWLKSSGGDVKLLTVIGACVGVKFGLLALCLGYILAGGYSVVVCIWHYGVFNIAKGTASWVGNLFLPFVFLRPEIEDDQLLKTGVPLGAHFALGTVVALSPIIPGIHF